MSKIVENKMNEVDENQEIMGSFTTILSRDLHKKLRQLALDKGEKLGKLFNQAIREFLEKQQTKERGK